MTPQSVLLSVDARGVATIALNRAAHLNALDEDSMELLAATLQTLAEDDGVRLVVLTGNGISFCAGHDPAWQKRLMDADAAGQRRQAEKLALLLALLDTLPQPTLARVQGSAFGIGSALVACCDIAVATAEALFGCAEVKLGLTPAQAAPYLIRAVGERQARRYLLSAERFNAGKAKRLGLIHQVVENDELDHAIEHLVGQLLLNGPQAMRAAKRLVADLTPLGVSEESREHCIDHIVALRQSEEGREGVTALIERRRPAWMR